MATEQRNLKCWFCGKQATVFHHRDPRQKEFQIGEYHRSDTSLQAEMEKCEPLCRGCHRKVHELLKAAQLVQAGGYLGYKCAQ